MSLQALLSAGFIVHTTIGNFCMMPMVYAASLPMPHEQYMEMTMTPMFPMSPVRCEHCTTIQSNDGIQSQGKTSCAGRCLSQSSPSVAFVSTQVFHASAAMPLAAPRMLTRTNLQHSYPHSTGPPVSILPTRTVVLLQ